MQWRNQRKSEKGNESEIVPDYHRLKYSCMLIAIKKNMFVKERLKSVRIFFRGSAWITLYLFAMHRSRHSWSRTLLSSQTSCIFYNWVYQTYFSTAKRPHFLFWHQKFNIRHFNLSKQLENIWYAFRSEKTKLWRWNQVEKVLRTSKTKIK